MANGQGQGLHVLLVVAVVIAVACGVAAGLMYQNWQQTVQDRDRIENEKKAAEAEQREDKELRDKLVDFADMKDVDIKKVPGEIRKYLLANDLEEVALNYPALVDRLKAALVTMTADRDDQQRKRQESEANATSAQEQKGVQREAYEKSETEMRGKFDKLNTDFETARADFAKQTGTLQDQIQELRTDKLEADRKMEELQKSHEQEVVKFKRTIEVLNRRLGETQVVVFDKPDAKVIRTNPADNEVYVDLGSDDKVRPGLLFAIYSRADAFNPYGQTQARKSKARIRIKKVIGPHLSLATTFKEVNPTDPIVAGDWVYSPLFKRNATIRVALAGRFDLDGDGKDDKEALKRLIRSHGGKIVCEVVAEYEDGKLVDMRMEGKLNHNTNWLLLGTGPSDEDIEAATGEEHNRLTKELGWLLDIQKQATSQGVPTINLDNFLASLGNPIVPRLTMAGE